MTEEPLDDLDQAILHLLQLDARNNTNTGIGEKLEVAASTVGTRINQMEEQEVIDGYHPAINYQQANLPLHTLFVCTAAVANQEKAADAALDLYGVIDVRETIAGENNLHIETVSQDLDEVKQVTQELDDLGLTIHRSELIKRHQMRPFDHFGSDQLEE